MESSSVPKVNGFIITVTNDGNGFLYSESVTLEILPGRLEPGYQVIGHGSAEAGGYTLNFAPYPLRPDILPVHIIQGNIGIIYQSKGGSLLFPEILTDTDPTEFSEILEERYNIPRRIAVFAPIKSYLRRGQRAALAGDLPKAIEFYQKALKEPETDLKPGINYHLALALFHSNRFNESIMYANEALRLDKNLWPKVLALTNAIHQKVRARK